MTSATTLDPLRPAEHDPRADLTRLVYDGTFEQDHADLRDALLDPMFDPREGLSLPQTGRLAYQRCRWLHARLERPLQILRHPRRLLALAEWPSLLDVSVFSLLMVHYNLCLGTVFDHGIDRPDLADYIGELDQLSSFGPYMATEFGYGNNVAALRTEAIYDQADEAFILNTPDALAQKYMSYSGFQDIPKIAVVLARVKADGKDHGVYPFLVRISDANGLCPGVYASSCPEKPVQGLDNGTTWFDNVRVPRRNLLLGDMGEFLPDGTFQPTGGNPRKRFLRAMSRIVPGRLCVSGCAVAAGRASVYIALRYAAQRLTNAPGSNAMPIIEYRSHQLALFTALAKVYAMTFLVNHAKREFLAHPDRTPASVNALISITKAVSTWEMTEVIAVCRERCGAQGMFSVNRIADYGSLLQGLVTAEGDNQVLLATTAGQLLNAPHTEQALAAPDGRGRAVDEPELLTELLAYRECELLRQAREMLADHADDRDYFESWNGTINTALQMARTRGARLAAEEFLAAVADARTEPVRAALRPLAAMYAITEVQRDAGWYLANSVLTADQARAIPAAIDTLCATLTDHVELLLAGLQLSPELLRAPIAADDYVAAFEAIAGARQPSPAGARS